MKKANGVIVVDLRKAVKHTLALMNDPTWPVELTTACGHRCPCECDTCTLAVQQYAWIFTKMHRTQPMC